MTKRILPHVLLSLVLSAATLAGAPRRLAPDNLATISFDEIDTLTLFNGDDGFFLDVPSDAVRVVINLTSSPSESEIDLFVRFDTEPVRGPSRSVIADYSSTNLGGQEQIEITGQSAPPLQGAATSSRRRPNAAPILLLASCWRPSKSDAIPKA